MKTTTFIYLICMVILLGFCACRKLDDSPIGKGVKRYEKYSDELGKERDVKVFGKDIIVEPEADKKIRLNF